VEPQPEPSDVTDVAGVTAVAPTGPRYQPTMFKLILSTVK